MQVIQKRFQYWGSVNGKAQKLWTKWFTVRTTAKEPIQLKGFKGNDLKNEYRTV